MLKDDLRNDLSSRRRKLMDERTNGTDLFSAAATVTPHKKKSKKNNANTAPHYSARKKRARAIIVSGPYLIYQLRQVCFYFSIWVVPTGGCVVPRNILVSISLAAL